jgi:hypothetical protein
MRFYYINSGEDSHVPYTTTVEEAKRVAREAQSRFPIEIHEVEVATVRENILRLLNNAGGTHVLKRTVCTVSPKR